MIDYDVERTALVNCVDIDQSSLQSALFQQTSVYVACDGVNPSIYGVNGDDSASGKD